MKHLKVLFVALALLLAACVKETPTPTTSNPYPSNLEAATATAPSGYP